MSTKLIRKLQGAANEIADNLRYRVLRKIYFFSPPTFLLTVQSSQRNVSAQSLLFPIHFLYNQLQPSPVRNFLERKTSFPEHPDPVPILNIN